MTTTILFGAEQCIGIDGTGEVNLKNLLVMELRINGDSSNLCAIFLIKLGF